MIRLSKQRSRARRRRGASLALAATLALAYAALTAAGASALGEQCSGSSAKGLGAFLQSRAQQRWTSAGELGFNGSANPSACSGTQGSGGKPSVGYVPVGSPDALHTWGADDGVLHGGEYSFLGTDIAPAGPVGEAGTMLANMKKARGSDMVVVPVTQTAIAIAANPPALPAHPACTVPRITAAQLEGVFSGQIKNWRQLTAASDRSLGGDCDQAITRIVRDEGAGTTYQLKHYLGQVNPAGLECTGKEKRTWAQLQAPFGGETSPNVEWPRNAQCQTGEGPVTTVAGPVAESESGPLKYVAEHRGTITYGSLPAVRQAAPGLIVDVNNGVKAVSPSTKEGAANCAGVEYPLPAGWEAGVNVDWSQVYGSDPNIGEVAKNAYPICTLSWDVAAANSVGVFGNAVATTVHDYLAFVVAKEGGQLGIGQLGYRELPGPVAKAAKAAIEQIGGEEGGEEEEGGGGKGTVLCKVAPELEKGVLVCPPEQHYTGIGVNGFVSPESPAVFKSTGGLEGEVVCTQGGYMGKFEEDGMSVGSGVYSFEFGLKEGCTTTFPEETEAIVKFQSLPYDASRFEYIGAEGPQGSFTLARSGGGEVELRIEGGRECIYFPVELVGRVFNGSPTRLSFQGKWKLVEESPEGACPTGLSQSAELGVTNSFTGESLYIAAE